MRRRLLFGRVASGWLVAVLLGVALIGVLATVGVDALTRSGEIEVRINAMRETDGDVIFALQQRQPSGAWSERQEPRVNRLRASHSGRWANSTPVPVKWEIEIEQEQKVVAVVSQIEVINGLEVEIDRYMEVETVPTEPTTGTSASSAGGENLMQAGNYADDYSAFCSNPAHIQRGSRISDEPSKALRRARYAQRNRDLTAAEWLPLLDLEIAIWAAVSPPAEFELFHNAMLSSLRSAHAAYAQRDPDEIVITLGPHLFSEVFLDKQRRTDWSSGLPEDVIRLIKIEGCIEAPEYEGGLMGG